MIMTNPEIKPREFWIEIGNECDDIVWQSPVNENAIHVIEYSAYEALKAENESLKKERTAYRTLNSLMGDNGVICELHDDIEALQAKLALAIEAMRQSRNRSDDYGDSWCSQPIREFLKQLEGEE